ncbi:hypothetical protein BLNAU_14777 [Blattamonas nauphoetae]|uniref:Uncharacterized protein n=1 Tax=Blattamonas nauphoetae TaxID=2049346 RepID=A0ABQ9XFU2_9EUKA|nr:hypothetical protein BLNAU_14777 [Blattamonas nauphoetae]
MLIPDSHRLRSDNSISESLQSHSHPLFFVEMEWGDISNQSRCEKLDHASFSTIQKGSHRTSTIFNSSIRSFSSWMEKSVLYALYLTRSKRIHHRDHCDY